MKKGHNVPKKLLALVLSAALIITALSGCFILSAEVNTEPYGTVEDGIYSAGERESVFYRDPVDFLKNGDFNEGLKYWAPNYVAQNVSASDYATVEDGVLTMSPDGSGANKVITSAAITVPQALVGKQMTALMWYKASASGVFQFGVYTDVNTNIYSDGYGNVTNASASDTWKLAAFNFTAPTSGVISLWLKADGASNYTLSVDKMALGTKNEDGSFNMFTDSFNESERITADGDSYYGTVNEGIYSKNELTSVFYRDALDYLPNRDFGEGLKYWAPSYTVSGANAAAYATVENGELKMSPTASGNKVVTSVAVNLPNSLRGKEVYVLMWSKASAAGAYDLGVYTNNSNNICTNGTYIQIAAGLDSWKFGAFKFTAPASGPVSIYIKADGRYTFEFYVKEVAFATKNADGTYNMYDTDFSSPTVKLDKKGTPLYGTAEEGIYNTDASTSVFYRDSYDYLMNADFSEGLKYWAPSYTVVGQNTAYYATVEDGALKMSPTGSSGNKVVTSSAVKIPSSLAGEEMAVLMWYKTPQGGRFQFGIYTDNNTNIFNNGSGNNYDVSAFENYKMAAFNFTAPNSGVISLYLKADGAYNYDLYVDKFAFATKNSDGSYNVFDGSFSGATQLINKDGTPYYGTETDGIYSTGASTSVFSRLPLEYLPNGDFSEGLKYWAPNYSAANQNTSYYASVTDGIAKLSVDGSGANKVITSSTVTVPASLAGKEAAVLMWYKASASGRFQFGIYTDNNTNIFNNGSGNIYDVSATEDYKLAAMSFIMPQSGVISLWLKADGASNYDLYVDKLAFATKNSDGSYNMFIDSFAGKTELVSVAGTDYYGTAEDGIYVGSATNNVSTLAPTNEFNGSFSDGLMYWGVSSGIGYASERGVLEDGMFKIIGGGANTYYGLRSVYYNIPEIAYGKNIVVKYDYMTDVAFAVSIYASNGAEEISKQSDNYSFGMTNLATSNTAALYLEEGYTAVAVSFKQYGVNDGDITKIGNFKFCELDDGGLNKVRNFDGTPEDYAYGDCNADGRVDLVDLVRMKKHMINNTTPIYLAAANTTRDADVSVTADDASVLINYILGKVEII